MRVACHLVPDLPLAAALRGEPELTGRPVAIASAPGSRAELVAISPQAARAGVRRGSSVTHARAVCSALCVRVASPALERTARAALLDAALSISPRAALLPPAAGAFAGEAAVQLDATGVARLFGSERGFATALIARAERLGLPGCTAVASSRRVAHIAARSLGGGRGPRIVAPGAEAGFLAPLPIDLLAPEDALAEQLTRFGVHRVCDLLDLPRRGLGARLGSGVLRLIALARGEEHEAPLAAPPRARLVEAADLDFPIDRLEPLGFALQALLSRLLVRLEARHLACGELGVALELEGGARDGRRVGVAAPTLELRVLVRLIRQSLETRPPRAPVIGAAIESEGRPLRRDQLDLFRPAGPAAAELDFALAELASLCGDDRVGSPVVADDHHPAAFGMTAYPPPPGGRTRRATEPPEGEPAVADGHRPALRLLRPPVPARVRLFQGRPEAVRSAVVSGRVVRLAGPWRTTGAWWSSESHFAYDSFDVQTSDGSVARLRFDHLRRTWHVDAVYD